MLFFLNHRNCMVPIGCYNSKTYDTGIMKISEIVKLRISLNLI